MDVALKVINGVSAEIVDTLTTEIQIMAALRHPHIVNLFGYSRDMAAFQGSLVLVQEFIEQGALYTLLHTEKIKLTAPQRLTIALDIVDGLRFLHFSSILHRDLKSLNVLITRDFRAKITDFGLSQTKHSLQSHITGYVGTPAWTSPEAVEDEVMRESDDVYSFGVILWELLVERVPWESLNQVQIVRRVVIGGERLSFPDRSAEGSVDHMLEELALECFGPGADRRTADEIHEALHSRRVLLRREEHERAREIPDAYICPISLEIMRDPVMCSDGHTYERAAIEEWLSVSNVSPKTNVNLESRRLIPNHALRQVIEGSGLLR